MPPAAWWVDADVLDLYYSLGAARRRQGDVHAGLDDCPGCPAVDELDVDWIPRIDPTWAVITKDRRQRTRLHEYQAYMDAGLGVFIVRSKKELSGFERTRLVLARWDEMVATWDDTPRPFLARVTRAGVAVYD